MADAVLVLDCGATNVRAIAISAEGRILGIRSVPNSASHDPAFPEGKIWDHNRIWRDFSECSRALKMDLDTNRIGAVTVTTFGVDGTLVDQDGNPLHPVISWQCERTASVIENVAAQIPELYSRCGLQSYPFNTIYKLVWLQKHRPEIISKAYAWLFISNIFLHRMTGILATDSTMAGTSMLTDLATHSFSAETLKMLGLKQELFPNVVEAGTVVGELQASAAADLGISAGLPVVSTGHDTQFALFGSGASENEPVLSSGTWEILMVRARQVTATGTLKNHGVTIEFDSERSLYNPGVMWIASGLVESLKRMAYSNHEGDSAYEAMITEGISAGPGSGGVKFSGDSVANQGTFTGIGINTHRGQLARAVFEHLALHTREALTLLEDACGFKAKSILCVGGGSKNRLWNQIRADVLNRPVRLVDRKETTAFGAACFVMPAMGLHSDPGAALEAAGIVPVELEPGDEAKFYTSLNQS